MRVVVLGDVGVVDGMMHIGDEAMFHAANVELGARGAAVTGVSSAPDDTALRHGMAAVARLRFDGLTREGSEARLARVLAVAEGASGLPSDDPAHALVAAVAAAEGVLIAGGGNFASTWPLHVYERAALAGVAARLGRPVVVSGQTFGPALEGRDRELVAELLRGAALVGVRETASRDLASALGTPARLGVDDASFIDFAVDNVAAEPSGVLVSLSLSLGTAPRADTVARIAALVDAAAEEVGGPVRFHAHFGPLEGGPRGDEVLHDEVRAQMSTTSSVVPTGDVVPAAHLARSSALLITGRYHPAVFAAPAGVPVLGLVTDAYTDVKQRGALAHWGQDAVVPIEQADVVGVPRMRTLWGQRARIAGDAADRRAGHRERTARWWDDVAAALG